MKITITINTSNAAFSEYPELEIARILRELSTKIECYAIQLWTGRTEALKDGNGNTVGEITIGE